MVAAIITIAITRALEIFELETDRRIEELEQQQIIAAERERYARELHDGAIQKAYTAGLLVESASRIADPKTEISKRLERALGILTILLLIYDKILLSSMHTLKQKLNRSHPCFTNWQITHTTIQSLIFTLI
jgi:signal transduction histidine kinase